MLQLVQLAIKCHYASGTASCSREWWPHALRGCIRACWRSRKQVHAAPNPHALIGVADSYRELMPSQIAPTTRPSPMASPS